MYRYLLPVLFPVLLAAPLGATAFAQDDPAAEEARPAEQAADEPRKDEPADDEADLDDGSYADAEEKDFVPSEDIPADQAIPFPTDI